MDSLTAHEILKWIIVSGAINATALLCIMAGLIALPLPTFPETCPWPPAQVLDAEFWPVGETTP